MSEDKRLFLLDGHALVYRAHYAFIQRPLINSKGMNTSAVTGFVRTLWDLMQSQKPSHIAVAFDPPTPTFRHAYFPEYKANREAQPEDISIALPYIERIVKAFRIPVVMLDSFEADDVIGTLAKKAEKHGFTTYMVTPDKDYGQLVSDYIFMYKPGRQGNEVEIMGVKEVTENWGIQHPDQVIDMLGLTGDSVDNIPGVPGIGPKTAAQLLSEYGTVEGVIAHAAELKGKQRERIEQFAEQALLSKRLATIDIEVPIEFNERDLELDPFDREALSEIFKELEFRSLAKAILGEGDEPSVPAPKAPANPQQGTLFDLEPVAAPLKAPPAHSVADRNIHNTPHQYFLVESADKVQELIQLLSAQKAFSLDTETTGLDPTNVALVGLSFSVKPGEGYYVPVPADQSEAQALIAKFKPVLENADIVKIGQNIKYDVIVYKLYGVNVKGFFFDTMVAHYLIEPELRHNMDYLSETYLGYQPVSIETLIGPKGKGQLSMREVPTDKICDYAAEDADVTLQLGDFLRPRLKEEKLENLYSQVEEPLIKTLADMEYEGINIDSDYLREYSSELEEAITKAEQKIYEDAGFTFNIGSPKQVGEVLFDTMKIPYTWPKTKTGQYSTDEEKLNELANEHPIVADILFHRGLAKLKSTYVDALPRMVNPRTGRVHSSFNQALAATGRLSSNNPNLQNIPIRTAEGRKVREAFIPRDSDHVLISADYSQIELRLIAEISGDEAMLEAFQSGQDIHRATAARVYGVPFDEVTSDQRRNAKTVNFSIIYGAGAHNLSRQLNIKRGEASELIKQYFQQYQGLRRYMDTMVKQAREQGFVTTLMGRRRYLRDINSRNAVIRSHAERNAINTPIQGTAADLIKMAMVNIHQALQEGNYKTKMVLQVHDELVFDVYKPELEQLKPLIEEKMRTAMPNLRVPILVEVGVGNNWLEAH